MSKKPISPLRQRLSKSASGHAASHGNVVLFCSGGNHSGSRGLPGGAEGIRTSDLFGAGADRLDDGAASVVEDRAESVLPDPA